MAGFFDALADAELSLLGVSVDRDEREQTETGEEMTARTVQSGGMDLEFREEHYRSALG